MEIIHQIFIQCLRLLGFKSVNDDNGDFFLLFPFSRVIYFDVYIHICNNITDNYY